MAKHRHAAHHAAQRRKNAGRVHGSLQRSLQALTIGTVRAREQRDEMLRPFAATNMIQCRQVALSGKATQDALLHDFDVDYPYPFLSAPAQTDADIERPHVAFGVELLTDVPVIILPQLLAWHDADEGWTEAARVRCWIWIPGARKKRAFSAMLHVTFSGYGAPAEDDPSETLDE